MRFDSAVDRLDAAGELPLHPVTQQVAGIEEGDGRADRRGDQNDQKTWPEAKQRAAGDAQDRSGGKAGRGRNDATQEEAGGAQDRPRLDQLCQPKAAFLELLDRQPIPHRREQARRDHAEDDSGEDECPKTAPIHFAASPFAVASAGRTEQGMCQRRKNRRIPALGR
ncbi:MAG: hypothetical protein WKF52_03725 [Sphingomicrobium sp.]